MVKCSVVILNWNGAAMLRQYLPSVVVCSDMPDTQIIVADNGSTDDSMKVLTLFPDVKVMRFHDNYGFAEGYNKALAAIDTAYTVLLNSDVEVTTGWLQPLIQYMDAHPDVVAVQPKILSWRSKNESSDKQPILFEHAGAAGGYIDMFGYPYCRGRVMDYVEQDRGQYDTIVPVFWTSGAAMCVRTAVYKECGGLDAKFFAHMEEIDLCWRMQSRGWKLACVPQSVVYHLGGGSLDYTNPRKTYLNFRNNLLMLYKNLPLGRWLMVSFCRMILDNISAVMWLCNGKADNAKAVWKARRDYRRMRSDMKEAREDNLCHAVVSDIPAMAKRSIVWDYYVRHRV